MRLLQGYFDDASRLQIDPVAEPLDIAFNRNHPLYEYNIFTNLREQGFMGEGNEPFGMLSWKFNIKTRIRLSDFAEFCRDAFAQNVDVAFINPMIGAEAMYKNVWEQGVHCGHQALAVITAHIFTPEEARQMEFMPASAFAFCHYFVATPQFWNRYLDFCDMIIRRADTLRETAPAVHSIIFSSAGYHRNLSADHRPFILERLFLQLLAAEPGYSPRRYASRRSYLSAEIRSG